MIFVKVFDPYKARELHAHGFSFMREGSGDDKAYIFAATPELLEYIHSHFDVMDYIYDKRLTF